jgi:hypothetical protein
MTNPVSQFRNGVFGSRGCNIQEAVDYVNELINTLPQTDQIGIRVGFGVLVNTIDNAVAQSQGPKPVRDHADLLSQFGGIYDKLVNDVAEKVESKIMTNDKIDESIDEWIKLNLRDRMMEMLEHDNIDDQISNWMSNNFDLDDYNVDGAIESWMDNNIDDKVYDAVNSISFTVEIGR